VNEFAEVGLTEEPGIVVKEPRVLESPIQFECKLNQVITIGDGSPGSADMVLGTIVYVHVREDVFNDGKIDVHALKPIGRLAGFSYCKVGDVFDIQRPKL
jgi:flavin reductase (DIM6/NTAB) family NADH-FMN oxidoreductase RutF